MNDNQPSYIVKLITKAFGGSIKGKRIATLGLAYKPDVDDLRESPAIEISNLLTKAGAQVIAFEPYKPTKQFRTFATASTMEMALKDADAIVLLVRHSQFSQLTPEYIEKYTHSKLIFDFVNCLSPENWKTKNFQIFGYE